MTEIILPNEWIPRHYQMRSWRAFENGIKRGLLVWHRRSGKDDFGLHLAATRSQERVGTYWHMLPEAAQARKAIWDAVDPHKSKRRIDIAFPQAIRSNTRDNDMMIRFLNGSSWQVVGSDNFDSLVGSPPIGIVFSEWALANSKAWAMLKPILDENGGWAVFNTTPRGSNHAAQMYRARKNDPDWFVERLTASDTGIFSPEQLEKIRRDYIADYGEDAGLALFEQEYECSFEAPVLGAFYSGELRRAEAEGRICRIPIDRAVQVQTAWDLGVSDSTAIWFIQCVGRERRLIDYHEASGVGLPYYADVLEQKRKERNWSYGEHYFPHDVQNRELGTGQSRIDTLRGLGIEPVVVAQHNVLDGINATRRMLDRVWIDPENCERGLEALRQYRREYDDTLKDWKKNPLHDWSSHGADALRTFAAGFDDPVTVTKPSDRHRRHRNPAPSPWAA